MSAVLEQQVIKKIVGLSDDNLLFLSEIIDKFMKPANVELNAVKRIGIKDGQKLYAEDYDYDELNEQISDMFGGDE